MVAFVGGIVIAACVLVNGGGVLLAFAGYSLGGAVLLVVTAALLTLRLAARDRSNLVPLGRFAQGT